MATANKGGDGVLKYDHTGETFPFISLISAKLVNSFKIIVRKGLEKPELTLVPSGELITGDYLIGKYLARVSKSSLYGNDALSATKIDSWIAKFAHFATEDVPKLVQLLNEHFVFRSFLEGFQLTLADIVLFSRIQLVKELKEEITQKSKTVPHLVRWLNYVQSLSAVQETVKLFTGESEKKVASKDGKESAAEEGPKKGLMGWAGNMEKLELPGLVKGAVCTRFPPEPSGYMHIGHCKAAVLNNYYATTYEGKIILRFDDTNPAKEKDEYVINIMKDLKTLGINFARTTHTSDYFDLLIEYAEKLITSGKGYVDNTPKEEISEQREKMIESVCRNNSVEKNMEWFQEMKKGSEFGQKCVLRAKIDMTHVDRTFRDPAMFRVNLTPHHKTGEKYKVYPLYDFACPIVDSIEGITHALRSNEYQNKVNLYYWVVDAFGLRRPYVSEYSRLNFTYVLLSKRKLQYFVDSGIVDSWTDPRLPTLQGIMRRGLSVDALREFVLSQGASSVNTNMDIGKLWAINKKFIEDKVPRYTCVPAGAGHAVVHLTNFGDKVEQLTKPKYDKVPEMGNKSVTISNTILIENDDAADLKVGEEITLMGWGMNIIVRSTTKRADGSFEINAETNPAGSFKDTKKKLTWLSDAAKKVNVVLQDFDALITKPKMEEEDKLEDYITKVTKFELPAIADSNILGLQFGDKIQFERRGLYVCDKVGTDTTPYVMVYIPDGSTKFKAGEALHPFVKREPKEEQVRVKPANKQQQKKQK